MNNDFIYTSFVSYRIMVASVMLRLIKYLVFYNLFLYRNLQNIYGIRVYESDIYPLMDPYKEV